MTLHVFTHAATIAFVLMSLSDAAAAVSVAVDWTAVEYAINPQAFGLNAFKGTDTAITGGSSYQTGLRYMLGARSGGGMLRIHTWEMVGTGTRTWISGNDWNAVKVKAAVRNLQEAGFTVAINIPATPGDNGVADKLAFARACASLVRIVNIEGRLGVKYWEIMNERDDVFQDSVQPLIERYNLAVDSMKKVDATIICGGPAFQHPHKDSYVKNSSTEPLTDSNSAVFTTTPETARRRIQTRFEMPGHDGTTGISAPTCDRRVPSGKSPYGTTNST